MRIFVVLPARDEARNIPGLVARIESALLGMDVDPTIVVVDDGSTDGTSHVARGLRARVPVEVVSFPENRGVASALRAGFEFADRMGGDSDVVVTMDADDTHDPMAIREMVPLIEGGADIVIASRFVRGGRMIGTGRVRALLSAGLSRSLSAVFGVAGVTDYSTFYRAYRLGAIRRTIERHGRPLPEGRGFEANTDFLIRAAAISPRIVEVPAVLDYGRKRGASKMRVARTILGYVVMTAANAPAVLSREGRRRR